MLILSVDTSTRSGSVALLREEELLGQLSIPADEPYSGSLTPAVARLLSSAGAAVQDIDLFAVAVGPGSFTGLRVGLTAVKAWAEVFGKPVAAISGLEAIAAQAFLRRESVSGIFLAPVLDARRGQVFGGLYRVDGNGAGLLTGVTSEVVLGANEFLELVVQESGGEPVAFASPTPEVIRDALIESSLGNFHMEQVSGLLAPTIGLLGHRKALRGDLLDAVRLDANYVRRSDAELHWKE